MKDKLKTLPMSLKVVISLLSVETMVLIVWAVVLVIVAMQSGQLSLYASYAFGIFYLIVAFSLLFAAHGILNQKRFGRSLSVVWQLFAVILGLQMFFAGSVLGLLAAAAGGAILILLFTKDALAYFAE